MLWLCGRLYYFDLLYSPSSLRWAIYLSPSSLRWAIYLTASPSVVRVDVRVLAVLRHRCYDSAADPASVLRMVRDNVPARAASATFRTTRRKQPQDHSLSLLAEDVVQTLVYPLRELGVFLNWETSLSTRSENERRENAHYTTTHQHQPHSLPPSSPSCSRLRRFHRRSAALPALPRASPAL